MYSIQLQMAELGEPEHHKHTCPHPAQKYLSNFKMLFLKFVFYTRVSFKNYNLAMISYFNKHFFARKVLNTKVLNTKVYLGA